MKKSGIAIWIAAAALQVVAPVNSLSETYQGKGQAVVTVLPKKAGAAPAKISGQDLVIKVNGKPATVTSWTPLQSPASSLELVLLIDNSARTSLGIQFGDITDFINGLPAGTKAAIAYMQNGNAVFSGPLSTDHVQVLRALHLPGGMTGVNSSPYFCLSDLAKRWPSQDYSARREVVMVTDGVDNYDRRFEPDDPYVQAAIRDSVRAGLIVYSIYWQTRGRANSSLYQNTAGQSLIAEVTEATGGKGFWMGIGNPVSFKPYFDELSRRFQNQYQVGFVSHLGGKAEVGTLKLKLSVPGTEVNSPQQVLVFPVASAQNPAQASAQN
jgi:hypothetical protein